MAQAALAHITTTAAVHLPANDNARGPGGKISKWHMVITGLGHCSGRLKVHAAQHKLKGWDVEEYIDKIDRLLKASRPGRDWLTGKRLKPKKSWKR